METHVTWLLKQVASGMLSWETVAKLCLAHMNDDDVEAMCKNNNLDDLCHTTFPGEE